MVVGPMVMVVRVLLEVVVLGVMETVVEVRHKVIMDVMDRIIVMSKVAVAVALVVIVMVWMAVLVFTAG